jgi:hypothetical protein
MPAISLDATFSLAVFLDCLHLFPQELAMHLGKSSKAGLSVDALAAFEKL